MVCFIDYLEAVKLLFFKSAAKVQKKNDMCKLKREKFFLCNFSCIFQIFVVPLQPQRFFEQPSNNNLTISNNIKQI